MAASMQTGGDTAAAPADPRGHVAGQLRQQAGACAAMGSPLYAVLLERAAADVEADGPAWAVLAPHVAPGRGEALALRFMAAVHRLVLTGRAPRLAARYPSSGGDGDAERAWPALRDLLAAQADVLRHLVALPCQTNEVGRAAALAGGFLEVAAVSGLPLRLVEVGASAGLNLRWDHFRYGGGGGAWGPADSPVDLTGLWVTPPARMDVGVRVVERRGCDPRPVDPTSDAGRLTLTASVWADQLDRLARLRGALRLAEQVPATVDAASVDEWLPARLARPAPGVATVVYHSVVEEYLPGAVRARFTATLGAAGERATPQAPLAWLRLEPVSALRRHGIVLTAWPGGRQRLLGHSGAHGTDVRWTA